MKIIIIIFLLISTSYLKAGSHFSIKYGLNNSKFYNDKNSSYLNGHSFGVDYEYSFINQYYAGIGLYYSKIGGWLNDKVLYVERNDVEELNDLYMIDIKAQAGYLKIPLTVGKNFPLKGEVIVKLHLGYSLIIPTADYTEEIVKYVIEEDIDPESDFEYDYRSIGVYEPVFPTGDYSNSMIDFGAGIVYKKICIDVSGHVQLVDFGTFDNISKIEKSLFSIEILFGFYF